MKNLLSVLKFGLIVALFSFSWLPTTQAQFIISGYQATSTPGQYDIFGSNLLSVTSLTETPYAVQGTTPYPLAFAAVSNQELTLNLNQNITSIVDLVFSSASYTDVEIPFVQGQINNYSFPLTVVTSGEHDGGLGSAVVLVLSGGTYGGDGSGSSTIFVENGGAFTGFGGGGSNALYYAPSASISNPFQGGGNAAPIAVDSINRLTVVPEASNWALFGGSLIMLAFWRFRSVRTDSRFSAIEQS
jgi:hypothetical protein